MQLTFETLKSPSWARPFELVERKGLGHPDTICDAIAETVSARLSAFYVDRFGMVLHHNVDKALLVGGRAAPAFGGGEVLEPVELYIAGRATRAFKGVSVPVEEIAIESTRDWFRNHLRAFDVDRQLRIECRIRPGSEALVALFERHLRAGQVPANDTSCGVGFAPLSPLESIVLNVEHRLNQSSIKEEHPEIGEDIKVMGIRQDNRVDLTVAAALVDRHVSDSDDYRAKRDGIGRIAAETARETAPLETQVEVNAADDIAAGDVYLTVTGTSAEAGDDGEVGRGNRANGLITPFRPMTLEAAAGKNPVSHVGKMHNVAAGRIAAEIVDTLDGVVDAECLLVSRIGQPVTKPQAAHLTLNTDEGALDSALENEISDIVRAQLEGIQRLWKESVTSGLDVF